MSHISIPTNDHHLVYISLPMPRTVIADRLLFCSVSVEARVKRVESDEYKCMVH